MKTSIRRFRLADLDRLLDIERNAFPKAAYPRDMFLDLYEGCAPLFFVAIHGRSMAGYSVTCTRPPRAELISIAVDRRFRRLGIADSLLRRTLSRLRLAGVARLNLMVLARNGDTTGVIIMLVDHGADPNLPGKSGRPPLIAALQGSASEYKIIPAAEDAARLLIERGAQVNVRDKDGGTPLITLLAQFA